MNFRTLKLNSSNEVLTCQLNRPEKRNALNLEMLGELLALFTEISQKQGIRVLVMAGAGKVFSSGADLSLMLDVAGKTEKELKSEAGLFFDCFNALYRLPIPTVCYVHGGVHGGANGLLAACDYTLADLSTRFSFGEVKLGLVPATVAPFIVRRTGMINARKMMLGGHVFGADEAVDMGLVDYLCTESEAMGEIMKISDRILQNAPGAIASTKKLLHQIDEISGKEDLRILCTSLIAQTRLSDEAKEGIEAFFAKRKPGWYKNFS